MTTCAMHVSCESDQTRETFRDLRAVGYRPRCGVADDRARECSEADLPPGVACVSGTQQFVLSVRAWPADHEPSCGQVCVTERVHGLATRGDCEAGLFLGVEGSLTGDAPY